MAKIIELCKYFAIEESNEGRFLIDTGQAERNDLSILGRTMR